VIVREASTADVQSIAEVHVAGWCETYAGTLPSPLMAGLSVEQRSAISDAAHRSEATTLLVGDGEVGAVVGFGAAGPATDPLPPFEVEVYALYVRKTGQGRGLGRNLLGRLAGAQLELGHRSALLRVVFRDNLGARGFGWRDLGPLAQMVDEGGRR
jgi:GNAT superfamily N-acetyltransferase